jgi:O-antigen ligase
MKLYVTKKVNLCSDINYIKKIFRLIGLIFFAVSTVVYLTPAYFKKFDDISYFYYYILPILSIPLVILNISVLKKKNYFFLLIFSYYAMIFLSTKNSNGQIDNYLNYSLIGVGYCSIINYFFSKNSYKKYLKILIIVLEIIVIINFISVIFNPNGLYKVYGYNNTYYNPAFILGHKNNAIEYLIPFIGLVMYNEVLRDKWFSFNLIFAVSISFMTVLLTKSVNSLLCISFIIVAYIYIYLFKKSYFPNIFRLYFISILTSFGVIYLKVQNVLKNIIFYLFKKDATLNSRTLIWDRAVYWIKKNFLFGYGIEKQDVTHTRIIHSSSCHNYFLDYLYQGGLVVFCLVFFMIYFINKKIEKCSKSIRYKIATIFGAYFILWIASPVHKDYIFIMFVFFIITINIRWDDIKLNEGSDKDVIIDNNSGI